MTVEISLPWNIMSREQLNTKVECSKKSPSVAGFAAPQLCLFLLPLPPSLPFRLQRVYNKTFIEPACIDCIGKYRSRSCSRFFFVLVNWPRLRFYPWTCKKELNRYFPNTDFKNKRLFWWNKSWKSRLLFQLRLQASSSIMDIYNLTLLVQIDYPLHISSHSLALSWFKPLQLKRRECLTVSPFNDFKTWFKNKENIYLLG